MSKPKTSLKEPNIDQRLIDERGPTKERMKGAEFEVGDTGLLTVRQSPIERAVARGEINETKGRAAAKFYMHWVEGQSLGKMGSADPLKIFGTTNDFCHWTDRTNEHWSEIRRALRAIHADMDKAGQSQDAVRLMELVICREISFAEAGMAVWPLRGQTKATALAIDRISSALRVLAIEWGL